MTPISSRDGVPANPRSLAWVGFEASFGDGFLARPEQRRQFKLNADRSLKVNSHDLTLFGSGYYGSSYIPALIPTGVSVPGDTIDPRQHDRTHNSLLIATDTWRLSEKQHLDFAGFFRRMGLTCAPISATV